MDIYRKMSTITPLDVGPKIEYRPISGGTPLQGFVTNLSVDLDYEHRVGMGNVAVTTYRYCVHICTKDSLGSLRGNSSNSFRISDLENWEFRLAPEDVK